MVHGAGDDSLEKFPFLARSDRVIIDPMKFKLGLTVAALFIAQSSLSQTPASEEKEAMLDLTADDRWEYRVTIVAPTGSKMPESEGVTVKEISDGVQSTFTKVRIYEGKTKPTEEAEALDTFRMERNGTTEEIEYSDVRPNAIYAKGWKKEGKNPGEPFLLTKPLLMIADVNQAGDQWEIKAGDGKTTPQFNRKFRVFGEEKVTVPAGEFLATRVEVTGLSGMTEIKRIYWFAKGVGFVKEEKTYYSKTTRLIQQTMELVKYELKKSS